MDKVEFEIPFGQLVGVDDSGRSYYYHNGAVTIIDVGGNLIRVVSEDTLGVGNRFVGIRPDGRVLLARPTTAGSTTTWYIEDIEIVTNEIGLLRLTSLCSPDPDNVWVWRVRNTNPDPVGFTWDVVGTDQTGSGTVPGGTEDEPGEVTFETVAVDGANTTRIFVDGEQQDIQDSIPQICQSPDADAGADQTVMDADNNGSEAITLDGSASSDSDGTITSYVWTENSTQIATGATPTVNLTVGTHTITLTVTDDDGLTSTDEVVVAVNPSE